MNFLLPIYISSIFRLLRRTHLREGGQGVGARAHRGDGRVVRRVLGWVLTGCPLCSLAGLGRCGDNNVEMDMAKLGAAVSAAFQGPAFGSLRRRPEIR